mgnify:CR=1 FL=1
MGIYWIYVNDTKKQWLNPGALGDNVKWPVHNSACALFELLKEQWRGDSIRALNDMSDEYFAVQGDDDPEADFWSDSFPASAGYPYKDVTSDLLEEYCLWQNGYVPVQHVRQLESRMLDCGYNEWGRQGLILARVQEPQLRDGCRVNDQEWTAGDLVIVNSCCDFKEGRFELARYEDLLGVVESKD